MLLLTFIQLLFFGPLTTLPTLPILGWACVVTACAATAALALRSGTLTCAPPGGQAWMRHVPVLTPGI
jgi:hypothetical protein